MKDEQASGQAVIEPNLMLRNLLGELQNRTVSAFTSRQYEKQNELRDEYVDLVNAHIVSVLEELKTKSETVKETRVLNGWERQAVFISDIDAAIARYKQNGR